MPRMAPMPFSHLGRSRSPISIHPMSSSYVGSDLIREHPNEYLRVRKAYNFHGSKIYTANSVSASSRRMSPTSN